MESLTTGGGGVIEIEAIGFVESSRAELRDDDWGGLESRIVLDARFEPDALAGIEDFSHVEVLFHFHRVDPGKIVSGARPPRNREDWPAVGIFAQRGKNRPNRLGSTIARVVGREGRVLRIAELDAVDGTPVIDLKPVSGSSCPGKPSTSPPGRTS